MPRVPVHREPKPAPHRRSREDQNYRTSHHSQEDPNYRHSRDYDQNQNGHVNHESNGHAKARSDGKPKRTISTLTAHLVAAAGEFVGTFMFLYFAFAGQIMLTTQGTPAPNGLASSQQNIFTALIYGFSLLVNVWAFYRISGGLFNPAVRPRLSLYQSLHTESTSGDARLGHIWRYSGYSRAVSVSHTAHSCHVRCRLSSSYVSWRYRGYQHFTFS